MKKMLLVLSFVSFMGATQALAQCKYLTIKRGQFSVSVKGVTNRDEVCYRGRTRVGQIISVRLISSDPSVRFNIGREYDEGNEDFSETDQQNAENTRFWEGKIGNADAFIVMVKGKKKGVAFTLKISVK